MKYSIKGQQEEEIPVWLWLSTGFVSKFDGIDIRLGDKAFLFHLGPKGIYRYKVACYEYKLTEEN